MTAPITIDQALGADHCDAPYHRLECTGDCLPHGAHGQALSPDSVRLLCELEDEGFAEVIPFSPLPLLRASVERQLAQLRAAAEQEFAIADAFQGAADDRMASAGRLQFRVDELAARLEGMS